MLERDSGSKVVIWIVERGRDPGLGSSRCNGSVRYIIVWVVLRNNMLLSPVYFLSIVFCLDKLSTIMFIRSSPCSWCYTPLPSRCKTDAGLR